MIHSHQCCTASVLLQWYSSVVVLRRMTGMCHAGVRMRREMSIRGSIVTHFSPIYKRTAVSKAPLCGCLEEARSTPIDRSHLLLDTAVLDSLSRHTIAELDASDHRPSPGNYSFFIQLAKLG